MVNIAPLHEPLAAQIEWRTSPGLVSYPEAIAFMEGRAAAIAAGAAPECVWLLEHPPLYTAGTSADPSELVAPMRLPVFETGRGGRYTWHGPGQRVAYVMLDLARRRKDVRAYVCALEAWMIATLARFGIRGMRREGRTGVWVTHDGSEGKIAAVGVRIRRWITYHGVALNVAPDLSHYEGIVPCGMRDAGVTSLAALGVRASMADVDAVLRETFQEALRGGGLACVPPD